MIMASPNLLSLPTELLQLVAIHAHATKDVLGLAHTNRALYESIATPFAFQMRLRQAGWDLRLWDEEANGLPDDLGDSENVHEKFAHYAQCRPAQHCVSGFGQISAAVSSQIS